VGINLREECFICEPLYVEGIHIGAFRKYQILFIRKILCSTFIIRTQDMALCPEDEEEMYKMYSQKWLVLWSILYV
jgi:hypothetical protein